MKNRTELRRELRRRRSGMTPGARATASERIARRIERTSWLRPDRGIGLYFSIGDEVDTAPLRQLAASRGCEVYLPRITSYRFRRMVFWRDDGRYRPNRLWIPEPVSGPMRAARRLDIVFVPLTGFDDMGYRLGAGGGFYDRLFAYRLRGILVRPLLIGIGFDCQRTGEFVPRAHDVPLDRIVTEAALIDTRRRREGRGR
jgi:5-formyltetrahydrofolate cyclo-ligase